METLHRGSPNPRLRHSVFLTVLLIAAFLEGWFLGPLGFEMLAGAIVDKFGITIEVSGAENSLKNDNFESFPSEKPS